MLGFFQSDPVNDPKLGLLTRRSGWWVGTIDLTQFGAVELRVAGGRREPDPRSVDLASRVPQLIVVREAEIAHELFEHYLPGLESFRSGEFEEMSSYPEIGAVDAVWPHVRAERVEVNAGHRDFTIEIACSVEWDEEHTLGVRLSADRLVELCGSIR